MGIIKNLINKITGKTDDKKTAEKKTAEKKTVKKSTTSSLSSLDTANSLIKRGNKAVSAQNQNQPAQSTTTQKTQTKKQPANKKVSMFKPATRFSNTNTSKTATKPKSTASGFSSLDAVNSFIELANKSGREKEKTRAKRLISATKRADAKKKIDNLKTAFNLIDDDYTHPSELMSGVINIDKRFLKTESEKQAERAAKLSRIIDEAQDTYTHIENGASQDKLLTESADFLKGIEATIKTDAFDYDSYAYERKLQEKQKEAFERGDTKEAARIGQELDEAYRFGIPLSPREKSVKLSDEQTKPIMYMSEDEVETYYYLLSSYGKDEAEDYFNTLKPKIIENAKKQNVTDAYNERTKTLPGRLAAHTIRGALAFGARLGDEADALEGQALQQATMSNSSGPFESITHSILFGLEANAPGIVLEFVPYVGPALSGITDFVYGVEDKYAELKLYGIEREEGAVKSIFTSAALQALPFGKLGSASGKLLTNAIAKSATRTGMRELTANLVGNALGGAVTGVTFFGTEEAADRFFMGKNSPYELSVKRYMSQGMSESEARSTATKDTLNSMVTAALVGSLQSAISGFAPSRKWGADFKKSGEAILDAEGADGISRVIAEAEGSSRTSESWRNAQRLKRRMAQGKEITSDMLGAQEYLNKVEQSRQQAYAAGITDITGIRILHGDADEAVNATYKDGSITLSLNPDDDVVEIIKHDIAHGAESANKYTFEVYKNQLRNAPGYQQAIAEITQKHKDAGLDTDKSTIESEVAAEFARNFVKSTKDIERLQRAVNGNPALFDRIYTAIRDLRAKMKAKGGTLFEDSVTGIKLRYDELQTLENLYEAMLINTKESFFADNSPMHSVKRNNDSRNFGVAIDGELNRLSSGKMSKLWNNNKSWVKETIREAYRSYKSGNTAEGDKLLQRAGSVWGASLKRGGNEEDVATFTAFFKKSYNDGEALKKTISRNKQTALDLEMHNVNIANYTKSLMSEIGVKKGRTNEPEEQVIREAFSCIKNNDEAGARELLISLGEDLYKRAERGYEGRDKEFISYLHSQRLKLDKTAEGGENISRLQKVSRGTYDKKSTAITPDVFLEEVKSLFPEYPWTKDTQTQPAPVDEILRIYDTIKANSQKPRYNPKDISDMSQAFADDVIDFYRKSVPANRQTPESVRSADVKRYGRDIEGGIRELEIDGMKESDVKECAQRARSGIDEIVSEIEKGIKSGIVDSSIKKYDEIAGDMLNTTAKHLMKKGYSADDSQSIAQAVLYELYEVVESSVNRYINETNDVIAKIKGKDFDIETDDIDNPKPQPPFDIYKEEKKIKSEAAQKRKGTADEIKTKLSRVFSNTMQKDFFADAEGEKNTRINSFVYESVKNRDVADAAVSYLNERGDGAVFKELATNEGGITAFDTAKAWALAARYRELASDMALSPEARTRYSRMMVEVLSVMREKWTEAGQAVQAIRMFNMLTLEGQILELKRRADSLTDSQMRKRPDYEQIKAEEQEAKKKDRANKAKTKDGKSEPKERPPRKSKETTPQSELEKVYKKYGIAYIPEETFTHMQSILKAIDEAQTAKSIDDVINIILENSRERKTNTSKRLGGKLRRYYNSEAKVTGSTAKPFEVLVNTARAQVFAMIDDAAPRSVANKLKSYRRAVLLDNPRTFLRNVLSNFFLTPAETITNNLAILPDLIMSAVTKRRGVGFEIPRGYINAGRRMRKAALEQNLKVDTFISSEGGYTDKASSRTLLSKFGTKFEELTGYNMTVTDEFQKGIIEKRVENSLKNLLENGNISPQEAAEIVAKEIKYRTFQDETTLGSILDGLQKVGNKIGFNEFGLGDLVVPFTKVPGAVITRNLEYSPAGYVKAAYMAIKTATETRKQHRKMTAAEQRDIALSIARATTSLGIIATGAILRSKGIIVGSDVEENEEDENYLLNKLRDARGIRGYKINLDALKRLATGGDGDIQDGDRLMEFSWAPFAPQLLVGAATYEETGATEPETIKEALITGFKTAGKSASRPDLVVNYTLDQLLELPALQGIRDISQSWEYRKGYIDFAVLSAVDWAVSFNPQLIRKFSDSLDKVSRDPYHGESTWERAWQKAVVSLPIMPLRNMVPERVNVLGETATDTIGSWWVDALNEIFSPGRVNVFTQNGITDELDKLYKYNDKALLKTPHTTNNNAEVEGVTVSFNLYGEDYEEFARLLGGTSMRNISALMSSEYYKFLPYNQRAALVAQVIGETETSCKTAWAEMLCGADDKEQDAILDLSLEEYKDAPRLAMYRNTAKEYVKKGEVNVEDVANVYILRPYTEQEIAKEVAKLKRGKFTKSEQATAEKYLSGKMKKRAYITGKWGDLTKQQQDQFLLYIDKYTDKVTIPAELMDIDNIRDMSKDGVETQEVIDITVGYDRQKLIDLSQTPEVPKEPDGKSQISVSKASGTASKGIRKKRSSSQKGSNSVASGIIRRLVLSSKEPDRYSDEFAERLSNNSGVFKNAFDFNSSFQNHKQPFIFPFDGFNKNI